MKTLTLLAATAALLGAGSAAAQEVNWTGPYVGVAFGAAQSSGSEDETILFDKDLNGQFGDTVVTTTGANAFSPGFCDGAAVTSLPGGGCADDETGFDSGVRLGYDHQFGRVVVGGLIEYADIRVEDRVSAFSTTPAFYTLEQELDGVLSARARLGYTFGRFLPYVTAGVARAELESSYNTSNSVNSQAVSGGEEADGYQLGLGGEVSVTPRFSLGLEYLRTSLESDDFRVRVGGPVVATNPFILTNAAGTDLRRGNEEFEVDSVRLTATLRY